MKNRNIIIGVIVVVFIIIAAVIWGTSNKGPVSDVPGFSQELTGSPIVPVASSTATSSFGTVALGVRTVNKGASYERIASEWIWQKTTYTAPGAASNGPVKGKPFSLVLNQDGSLSVKGDCNSISGTYTLDKNTVSALETEDEMALGDIKMNATAMTKKACTGSKEASFLAEIAKVTSYDMRTTQMTLLFPNGTGYMVFKRNLEVEG